MELVTRRECERVIRDAVRIAEQLDQLGEELVVLQLVRVEPLVVLAQLLRQSLRLGETIGFGRRHRTVLYSKRAGRARPPSGSWRPGRRICFDGLQVRRVLLSLQLVALVVGLTACGGDTLALDPAASAATKTVEAGSSRVEFEIAMKVAGESMDMTGSGAFDYRDPRGEITYRMDVPVLGEVSMDLRMIGTKLYLRLPQEIAGVALPGGKPWAAMDLSKSLEQAGLGSLDFTQQQDPAQTLQYLRAASVDVKETGTADVRGVETTRYTGRMDFRKALDAGVDELELSAAEREQARKGMQWMLEQLGSDSVPFEVFVDEDGLLRRMTMDLAMKVEGEQMSMSMRMDYFDFGIDVDVQAPPARDVTDATDLLQP